MRILSIDPGKRSIAWALWQDKRLILCGFEKHTDDNWYEGTKQRMFQLLESIMLPNKIVVELPRMYPRDRNKRPNDLIDLATIAGMCGAFGETILVHPQKWKGQLPKHISAVRTLQKLSKEELIVVGELEKNHNVMDAVGIGLWFVRR
jgi:hypothetical protein